MTVMKDIDLQSLYCCCFSRCFHPVKGWFLLKVSHLEDKLRYYWNHFHKPTIHPSSLQRRKENCSILNAELFAQGKASVGS